MNESFSRNSFPGAALFVATPMHGGMCTSGYLAGMVDLAAACTAYGIGLNVHGTEGESMVQMARNLCVHAFLASDYTHFLFIDADIGFSAKDVLSLLRVCTSDTEGKYSVVAGPYPKKNISWEKVRKAVKEGLADSDPKVLEKYLGNYTFLQEQRARFSIDEPVEVTEIGTGFMMIPRKTLQDFCVAYPEKRYRGDKGNPEFAFFNCGIDPESGRFLPEDSRFCIEVRKMGGKVWLAPWLRLVHQGMYSFQGSLEHIAKLGMSPADL